MTPHHVAHVQLRHLVVRHVGNGIARLPERLNDGIAFSVTLREAQANEDLCRLIRLVAVVEFRDAAPAQHFTEVQETTRLLGYDYGKQCLTLTAHIGTFRNVPQAVEIHVGAAVDRDDAFVAPALPRDEFLDACDRERSGRLDNRARILEHVLNGGADLIRIQKQDLIDILAAQRQCLFADPLHGDAVREDTNLVERHAAAGP